MNPAESIKALQLATDTVWIVAAGALVFFMQAGFALLESGMSRSKNAINVIMKNYCDMCFGALIFWMVGYGLMFGANPTGWYGTSHFFMVKHDAIDYTWMFFQAMFAATAATIVSGAIAERTQFWAYIIGSVVITGFIYAVYGSWAWGSLYGTNGWLKQLGFIDFAGSTVVHSIGGWCALAGVIIVKARLGRFGANGEVRRIPGHNLSSVALGAFILWLGWFGFNGGSTVTASVDIGKIVLNTHISGAAGAVGAMLTMGLLRMPTMMSTTVNASIAGLVAITAGCATMEPNWALATGLTAGFLTVVFPKLLEAMRLDDVVGAVTVHGVCGAWGTLAAGLFKTDAMFSWAVVKIQLIGIGAAFAWAFPVALVMYWLIDKTVGMRAPSLDEQRGLDYTEHYEVGYPEFQRDSLHQGRL
ncbi:ammonium transporter [Usitatibacter palustris]|uniref:Ammonium transporter n=1 Tax=Usitatibacter palustris TaxID=2732487 RepID=A0A6M4H8X6_9PROT|nr:ammonium transporter [Usitatibacter palustris]QJR16031.1 Ammonia channel [Usitatibacter palustris]